MGHVITVGDLFWPACILLGTFGVLGLLGCVLSIFASGWKH